MTAAMDFGALPPEINSARMYAGAGPAPERCDMVNIERTGMRDRPVRAPQHCE